MYPHNASSNVALLPIAQPEVSSQASTLCWAAYSQGTSELIISKTYVFTRTCFPGADGWVHSFSLLLCWHKCFIAAFKKSPLCLSPSCLRFFVPFSVSRFHIRGLVWFVSGNCILPWGLVSFSGDKL